MNKFEWRTCSEFLQLFIFFIILDFSTTTLLVVETHYPEIPVGKAFGLSEHANLFFSSAATKPKAHVALHLSWEKQDFLARSWLLQAPEYDFLETGQLVFLEPSETLWPPLCDIALGRMLQSYKICSNMCFLKGLLWHIDHDELNKDSRSHSWLFLHNTGDWVKC